MKPHGLETDLPAVLAFLFLVMIGIILLSMPHRIQRIAALDRWGPFKRPTFGGKFIRRYTQSRLYIWDLRIGGTVALVFAGLLLYDLLFR